MSRKLILFGNGLGMALDPVHFKLERALKCIWDNPALLNAENQKLISHCTGKDECPTGEGDLADLHLAVTACRALGEIGGGDIHWLSKEGKQFPNAIANYFYDVSTNLYKYDGRLPPNFIDPLIEFIKKTNSHVATLNYDKLLYESFINTVCNGNYQTSSLVDGMVDSGFHEGGLKRKCNDYGYYLHLHGSPLYLDDGERIYKKSMGDAEYSNADQVGRHIVLNHVKHKMQIIEASPVLRVYWEYFRKAAIEADEIIIFGYSGEDTHINKMITQSVFGKLVRVVEWSGAGDRIIREIKWRSKLKVQELEVFHMENILEFNNW